MAVVCFLPTLLFKPRSQKRNRVPGVRGLHREDVRTGIKEGNPRASRDGTKIANIFIVISRKVRYSREVPGLGNLNWLSATQKISFVAKYQLSC